MSYLSDREPAYPDPCKSRWRVICFTPEQLEFNLAKARREALESLREWMTSMYEVFNMLEAEDVLVSDAMADLIGTEIDRRLADQGESCGDPPTMAKLNQALAQYSDRREDVTSVVMLLGDFDALVGASKENYDPDFLPGGTYYSDVVQAFGRTVVVTDELPEQETYGVLVWSADWQARARRTYQGGKEKDDD